MTPQTEVLTLKQVAEWLQVSERTVLRLLEDNKINGFKIGGQWRFRGEDVDAYLQSLAMSGSELDKRRAKEAKQGEVKQAKQRAVKK